MKPASAPVSSFDSVSPRYRAYVLGLLTVVFIINFIDRQLLYVGPALAATHGIAFAASEPAVSLRYGLLAVLIANIPAAIGYLMAAGSVREEWRD